MKTTDEKICNLNNERQTNWSLLDCLINTHIFLQKGNLNSEEKNKLFFDISIALRIIAKKLKKETAESLANKKQPHLNLFNCLIDIQEYLKTRYLPPKEKLDLISEVISVSKDTGEAIKKQEDEAEEFFQKNNIINRDGQMFIQSALNKLNESTEKLIDYSQRLNNRYK